MLRLEVTGETFATVREAVAQLRRTQDGRVDDDAALLAMARALLGGPNDGGRSSYQISLSVCPICGRGTQRAAGDRVEVSPEAVEMARCDAQQVALYPSDISRDATPTVLSLQRQAPANDGQAQLATDREGVPSCLSPRVRPAMPTWAPKRRKTTGPITGRPRACLRPFGAACCTAMTTCVACPAAATPYYRNLHHLTPRAEGGPNVDENLVTLCGVHHRAAHAGELLIEGRPPGDLRFLHADGTPLGGLLDPRALDANAKVFSALRNLGFRDAEARRVLEELRHQPHTRGLDTAALLRAALERLGARRA